MPKLSLFGFCVFLVEFVLLNLYFLCIFSGVRVAQSILFVYFKWSSCCSIYICCVFLVGFMLLNLYFLCIFSGVRVAQSIFFVYF